MWMITDFTEENGATRVVPGSHLSGRQPDPSIPHPVATVAITGPAGSAMAFDGRLWHGAAANTTSESRFGITMAGCGPQFRPIENYTRGLRPEVFEKLHFSVTTLPIRHGLDDRADCEIISFVLPKCPQTVYFTIRVRCFWKTNFFNFLTC